MLEYRPNQHSFNNPSFFLSNRKFYQPALMTQLDKEIITSLSKFMDPLQIAYRHKCSTYYAITFSFHAALTHLDGKMSNYVKMQFVDYSSAFYKIILFILTIKLNSVSLDLQFPDKQTNMSQLHSPLVLCEVS